jgi:hypothetical protein
MILRWVGAALAETQRGFRHIRGHEDLSKLVGALTCHGAEVGQQEVA